MIDEGQLLLEGTTQPWEAQQSPTADATWGYIQESTADATSHILSAIWPRGYQARTAFMRMWPSWKCCNNKLPLGIP